MTGIKTRGLEFLSLCQDIVKSRIALQNTSLKCLVMTMPNPYKASSGQG